MVDLKLIIEALKLVDGPTGNPFIDQAKGKNKYPSTFKGVLRMVNYRYG